YYNRRKYNEAASTYIKAIQLDPGHALKAYLNLARAYNMLKRYDEATQYYQWYLDLTNKDEDSNVRKVEAEMKKASRRAKGETKVVTEAQVAALDRLQKSIETGPFMTDDGGGAIAL